MEFFLVFMENISLLLDIRKQGGYTILMIFENICNFIPPQTTTGDLHILHLVHETSEQRFDGWKTLSYYRMHYVLEGSGVLHTQNGEYRLSKGDVFFCLPSMPYALQSLQGFRYGYIGYLGAKANATAEKYKISVQNCVFKNLLSLGDAWQEIVNIPSDVSALYAEGLFLCTVSMLAAKTLSFSNPKKERQTTARIKKYIDENFADPDLSLQSISTALSYNTKYVSTIFKKEFQISFKEYLNTLRIHNACALMRKGFTSVKDLSFLCGFNDPLYFSKVFKAKMKIAPSAFLSNIILEKNNQT